MKVKDLMAADGRVFLKSEWGPIGDHWPCVSFTKLSVGNRLRQEFQPGRDVLVYVGTTDPNMTEDPAHRSRLLSAVVIQPKQVVETKKIVPAAVWEQSVRTWGKDRWPHSMAVIRATEMMGPPFPEARRLIPKAYASFAEMANRGGVVEAMGSEREAVMELEVREIELTLSADVQGYLSLMKAVAPSVDKAIKQEIARMAMGIQQRVASGGEASVRINPQRSAPNISDLVAVLTQKWLESQGRCGLCHGRLVTGAKNRLLQPSPDRIDSQNGAYNAGNVQITHLACNWAKNQYGMAEFVEWLDAVRGEDEDEGVESVNLAVDA